jgi:hypothetical protein
MAALTQEGLWELIHTLGWDVRRDEIVLEVGGMAVTGTATNPDANPKWAKPFGTVTYQKDAFIVIKNVSRSPFEPSKSNEQTNDDKST